MVNRKPNPGDLPVHSSIDNRLIGWIGEPNVQSLLSAGRARLIRDRKGIIRRVYLSISASDEYDPRVWDLLNRMSESRKLVTREIVSPATHRWVWRHRLTGTDLEALREISIEELTKDGILKA